MNRRSFLAALVAAFAAPSVVIAEEVKPRNAEATMARVASSEDSPLWMRFDASKEYGMAMQVTTGGWDVQPIRAVLFNSARHTLPPGTKFYVLRAPEWALLDDPVNEFEVFAWYYSPNELSEEKSARVVCEATA